MPILETLKRRRRRFYKSLILGLSVSLITSLVSYMGYLQSFEAKALDFLLWLRGSVKSPEIVLVQIDDQAFSRLGEKQPLPRSYIAGLIDVLGRSGAKVIGVDIEFKVKTNPRDDAMLLKAIQDASDNGLSRVVPVFVVRPEKEVNGRMLYSRAPFFSPTLPVLSGFANAPIDPDGVFRQLPLAVHASDGKTPAPLAAAPRFAAPRCRCSRVSPTRRSIRTAYFASFPSRSMQATARRSLRSRSRYWRATRGTTARAWRRK